MKNFFTSALLLLALLLPASAAAYNFEEGGIYYNYCNNPGSSDYAVEVTSPPSAGSYTGTVIIPATVTHDGTTYLVISIGKDAFSWCKGLKNVVIPNSVITIRDDAFYACNLLANVNIPNSVTSIGKSAFNGCDLTSVTIPASVTSIGEKAFAWCVNLANLAVESGNTRYDSRDNCNAIIETANNKLITGCQNTVIPTSVISIGSSAFEGSYGMQGITIPNSVVYIDDFAFYASDVKSITIGTSLVSIGERVFTYCNLASIVVDSGNKTFDSRDDCNAIIETASNKLVVGGQNTIIPNTVTSIGDYAFAGCRNLMGLTIPNTVTSIGYNAFQYCSGLKEITIPNSVTKILSYTFADCTGLTSVNIPNTVTAIGWYAFYGCTSLTSITIPHSVTFIGWYAFSNCYQLKDVYSYITDPQSVDAGNAVFKKYNDDYSGCTLHVPCGTVNDYQADEHWSPYFEQIVEIDPETELIGDVNFDGQVDIADINAIMDIILGIDVYASEADVNRDGEVTIADINAIMDIILVGNEQPEAEHEYVDLGLPSGTLWATCNIGANSPEEYGDYFAWGEIEPKSAYDWTTYKWCNGSEYTLTKYCTNSNYGTVDGKNRLELEDDAACMNWGSAWRMPTNYQLRELGQMCTWEKMSRNGVSGFQLTGPNGNSLFLPAADMYDYSFPDQGFSAAYWSGMLDTDNPDGAYYMYAASTNYGNYSHINWRASGCPVRAVRMPEADSQSLYIERQNLDIGGAFIGTTCTGKLTVINNSKEEKTLTVTTDAPFSLVQEEGSATSMTVVVPSNSIASVTVMFTATTPGEFNGTVTFLNPAFDGGQSVIPIHAIAVNNIDHEQEYVDLGLPSGTLWATCNIGAKSLEEYGDYFAWGEIEPKDYYDLSTYKWCDGNAYSLTKYCTDSNYGTVDNKMELDPEDDAAWVNWGPMWRMPTIDQISELRTNCSSRWTSLNGIPGCLVIGPNGNTMFLPAAGYVTGNHPANPSIAGDYWSRSLNIAANPDGPIYSYEMDLTSSGLSSNHMFRELGYSVRAVRASLSDVYIDQQSLDLGVELVGETSTGELTIVNCTDESLTLTATIDEPFLFQQGEGSASSLTIEVPGKSCARVTVMFTSSAPGEYDGHVIFTHPALDGGECAIPVHVGAYSDLGQDYVDLGLPSGTLWATRNVGAASPEELGDYFAWGETKPKDDYSWDNYKWTYGTEGMLTKYCTNSEYGIVDGVTELDPQDDAAWVNCGPTWRMPSLEQQDELRNECSWRWITRNGVNGYLVTGPNGNTIFLPAAGSSYQYPGRDGNYWSRTLSPSGESTHAVSCEFNSLWSTCSEVRRSYGYTVRPVCMSLDNIYIEQKSLDLGIASIGNTCTGYLTIVNGSNELVMFRASVDGPFSFVQGGVTVSSTTIEIPAGLCVRVAVSFTATTSGQFNGNATFILAMDGSQTVIPISVLVFPDVVPQQDAVDLGLSSGTLWATCNVGANSPEEFGDSFVWGMTDPMMYCEWTDYKWCDGSFTKLTKYCTNANYGTVDGKTELDPEDDAAWVNWGPSWCMPSDEQLAELEEECTWKRTKMNGVEGRLIIGPNGNSIFLPAPEDYWSRTLNAGVQFYAMGRSLEANGTVWYLMWSPRNSSCKVRAVRVSQE